jgi:hypothetical protein
MEACCGLVLPEHSGHSSCQEARRELDGASLHPWHLCYSLVYPSDEWRRSYRRVWGPLVRLARSAILSIALCQPASASFMALNMAALVSAISGETLMLAHFPAWEEVILEGLGWEPLLEGLGRQQAATASWLP